MPQTYDYVPPPKNEPSQFAVDMGWDDDTDLIAAVFQTLGAASMCWTETPSGIFDSEQALGLGSALIDFIRQHYQPIDRDESLE